MYHGEIFKLPITYNKKYLGNKIGYIVMSSLCSFDIDDSSDLDYLNMRLKTDLYEKFIH
jgi:CMP-N-acetylneuraminic acid synthetase